MRRSHHELLLARGWWQAGENRYLRRLESGAELSVIKLATEAGGGWAWRLARSGDAVGRYPSRLSAAAAAEVAHNGGTA